VRDRFQRKFWHALNRYDELKRGVRENQAGRSAVGLGVLLLLGVGAALGFIAANAAAGEDGALTPARASNVGNVYTVTQTIVHQKQVPAKQAGRQPQKTLTVTTRSPTLPTRTVTLAATKTLTRSHTVTVTEVQPTTVTVTTEEDKHPPKPGPG